MGMTQEVHEQHSIVDQLFAELKRTYYAGQRPSYAQMKLIAPALSLDDYKLLVQRFMEYMREQEVQTFKEQERQLSQAYPYMPNHVTEDLLFFEQSILSQFARFLVQRDQSIAAAVAQDMEQQRKQLVFLNSENAMLKRENRKLQVQIAALENSLTRLDESYQFECKAHQQAQLELNKLREREGAGYLFVKLLKQHLDSPELANISKSLSHSTAEALISLLSKVDNEQSDTQSSSSSSETFDVSQEQIDLDALMEGSMGEEQKQPHKISSSDMQAADDLFYGNPVFAQSILGDDSDLANNLDSSLPNHMNNLELEQNNSDLEAGTESFKQGQDLSSAKEPTSEAEHKQLFMESELSKYRHIKVDDLSSLQPTNYANALNNFTDKTEARLESSLSEEVFRAPLNLESLNQAKESKGLGQLEGNEQQQGNLLEQGELVENNLAEEKFVADEIAVLEGSLDESEGGTVNPVAVEEVTPISAEDDESADSEVKDPAQLSALNDAAQRLAQMDNSQADVNSEDSIKASLAAIVSSEPLLDETEVVEDEASAMGAQALLIPSSAQCKTQGQSSPEQDSQESKDTLTRTSPVSHEESESKQISGTDALVQQSFSLLPLGKSTLKTLRTEQGDKAGHINQPQAQEQALAPHSSDAQDPSAQGASSHVAQILSVLGGNELNGIKEINESNGINAGNGVNSFDLFGSMIGISSMAHGLKKTVPSVGADSSQAPSVPHDINNPVEQKIDELAALSSQLFVDKDSEDVTSIEIEELVRAAIERNVFSKEQEGACRRLVVKLMFLGRDAVFPQDAEARVEDILNAIPDLAQRFFAQAALTWQAPQKAQGEIRDSANLDKGESKVAESSTLEQIEEGECVVIEESSKQSDCIDGTSHTDSADSADLFISLEDEQIDANQSETHESEHEQSINDTEQNSDENEKGLSAHEPIFSFISDDGNTKDELESEVEDLDLEDQPAGDILTFTMELDEGNEPSEKDNSADADRDSNQEHETLDKVNNIDPEEEFSKGCVSGEREQVSLQEGQQDGNAESKLTEQESVEGNSPRTDEFVKLSLDQDSAVATSVQDDSKDTVATFDSATVATTTTSNNTIANDTQHTTLPSVAPRGTNGYEGGDSVESEQAQHQEQTTSTSTSDEINQQVATSQQVAISVGSVFNKTQSYEKVASLSISSTPMDFAALAAILQQPALQTMGRSAASTPTPVIPKGVVGNKVESSEAQAEASIVTANTATVTQEANTQDTASEAATTTTTTTTTTNTATKDSTNSLDSWSVGQSNNNLVEFSGELKMQGGDALNLSSHEAVTQAQAFSWLAAAGLLKESPVPQGEAILNIEEITSAFTQPQNKESGNKTTCSTINLVELNAKNELEGKGLLQHLSQVQDKGQALNGLDTTTNATTASAQKIEEVSTKSTTPADFNYQPAKVINSVPRSLLRDEKTLVREISSPSGDDSIAAVAEATAKLESLVPFLNESKKEAQEAQDILFNFKQDGTSVSHISSIHHEQEEHAATELAQVAKDVLKVASELEEKSKQETKEKSQVSIFDRCYEEIDLEKAKAEAQEYQDESQSDFVSGNMRSEVELEKLQSEHSLDIKNEVKAKPSSAEVTANTTSSTIASTTTSNTIGSAHDSTIVQEQKLKHDNDLIGESSLGESQATTSVESSTSQEPSSTRSGITWFQSTSSASEQEQAQVLEQSAHKEQGQEQKIVVDNNPTASHSIPVAVALGKEEEHGQPSSIEAINTKLDQDLSTTTGAGAASQDKSGDKAEVSYLSQDATSLHEEPRDIFEEEPGNQEEWNGQTTIARAALNKSELVKFDLIYGQVKEGYQAKEQEFKALTSRLGDSSFVSIDPKAIYYEVLKEVEAEFATVLSDKVKAALSEQAEADFFPVQAALETGHNQSAAIQVTKQSQVMESQDKEQNQAVSQSQVASQTTPFLKTPQTMSQQGQQSLTILQTMTQTISQTTLAQEESKKIPVVVALTPTSQIVAETQSPSASAKSAVDSAHQHDASHGGDSMLGTTGGSSNESAVDNTSILNTSGGFMVLNEQEEIKHEPSTISFKLEQGSVKDDVASSSYKEPTTQWYKEETPSINLGSDNMFSLVDESEQGFKAQAPLKEPDYKSHIKWQTRDSVSDWDTGLGKNSFTFNPISPDKSEKPSSSNANTFKSATTLSGNFISDMGMSISGDTLNTSTFSFDPLGRSGESTVKLSSGANFNLNGGDRSKSEGQGDSQGLKQGAQGDATSPQVKPQVQRTPIKWHEHKEK